MSTQGLYFLVNTFDLAGGYFISCMCYDALKVIIKQFTKPQQVLVVGCFTDVHDIADCICHPDFVGQGIRRKQFFLNEIL